MAHNFHKVLAIWVSAALALGMSAQAQTNVTIPAVPAAAANAQAASTLAQAQGLLQAGNFKGAQALFEGLIAADYSNQDAHFGLGLALAGLNDVVGARFEFSQLIKLAPDRYEGYYNLGVIAARQGQYDEALSDYQKALSLAAGKASTTALTQIYTALATEQTRRMDWAGLQKTLTDQAALSPDDLGVQLRLADATVRTGDLDSALPLAYGVLNRDPASADAALLVADIYAAGKQTDRAVRVLYDAIGHQGSAADRARLFTRQSQLLLAAHRSQDALKAAQAAVKANAKDPQAQLSLGDVNAALGDKAGAVAAYHAAVQIDPNGVQTRLTLATAELAANLPARAATDAALVLKNNPDSASLARAQYILGVTAYAAGRYKDARQNLQASVQAMPDAAAFSWLGLSSYALKDYPAAVAAFQSGVQLQPALPARANLGAAQLAAGLYQDAQTTLKGVVGESPSNALAWYQLGWAERNLGQSVAARAAFKKALALGYTAAKDALR